LIVLPVGEARGLLRSSCVSRTSRPACRRSTYHMSEFFVTRKSRKLGIGRDAAVLMFNRFAGEWEVTEYLRNPGAVQFWRRVIGRVHARPVHGARAERRGPPALSHVQQSAAASAPLTQKRGHGDLNRSMQHHCEEGGWAYGDRGLEFVEG